MRSVSMVLLGSFALAAPAQDKTEPAGNTRIKFVTKGVGVQIYACQPRGSEYAWVLQEPQADLIDTKSNAAVGTHSKGPTWTWKDGSAVTGKVLQTSPSGDPAANIPWLLLDTQSNGSQGALSNVTYVRRSDTQGGVATASGCSEATKGTTSKVPYAASYTFYTAGK